jgi:hypothetical protein
MYNFDEDRIFITSPLELERQLMEINNDLDDAHSRFMDESLCGFVDDIYADSNFLEETRVEEEIADLYEDGNGFLDITEDIKTGQDTYYMSTRGLEEFYNYYLKEINPTLEIISQDTDVEDYEYSEERRCKFCLEKQEEIKKFFETKGESLRSVIIHRKNHTISAVKQDDCIFVMDSYNASGVPDNDLSSTLRIIRDASGDAKIFVLNDILQFDYSSCRYYSILFSSILCEYLTKNNLSLRDFIGRGECVEPFYTAERLKTTYSGQLRDEVAVGEEKRQRDYGEMGVMPIGTPYLFVPFTQRKTQLEFYMEELQEVAASSLEACKILNLCKKIKLVEIGNTGKYTNMSIVSVFKNVIFPILKKIVEIEKNDNIIRLENLRDATKCFTIPNIINK